MNIEKIVDGVKVFVRNQIYGKQSDATIYPQYLQTAEEKKEINERKNKVAEFSITSFSRDMFGKDFMPSDSGYK
jgi:hypothetical protein